MPDQTLRDYYNRRKTGLKLERESFIPHYKELSEFVRPRRGRFFIQDRNQGDKRYHSIINSKATQAHKIATSGMLAGTMSPTRPWFSLETHNPDRMKVTGVREYLYLVEKILMTIFNESNLYGMASHLLDELLLFGTAAMTHVDDFDDVARFYTHTAGSYLIGANDRQEIDTLYREFEWTAEQIVKAFGRENVSKEVNNAIDMGNYESWFPVNHIIEPNRDYKPSSKLARNKPYSSVYFEPGNTGSDKDKYLRVSGFDEFNAYIPRWDVTGADIYATDCPGMTALGDIKGLQVQEKRKAQGVDKMVNPPLTGPPSVKNVPISSLPGGLSVYDSGEGRQKLESLYNVQLDINQLRADMDAVEQRIDKAFFVDMFLAITNVQGVQPRNQMDLMHRNEERLLQLGPVLERIHNEFLDPLIERTFNQAARAGILPQPPEELQGAPLRINYVSTLAMAQRAVTTQNLDKFLGFAGNMMQLGFPQVADKINQDQVVEEYANAVGTPPSIVRGNEETAAIRQSRAQQQAMQQGLDGAQSAASTVKTMADAQASGQGGE